MLLEMNYDVIVVGAGPGGSTCARYLAKTGLNVALIEKDEFPRDKPCGGGSGSTQLNSYFYEGIAFYSIQILDIIGFSYIFDISEVWWPAIIIKPHILMSFLYEE